jgi:DnaK suppressor protein
MPFFGGIMAKKIITNSLKKLRMAPARPRSGLKKRSGTRERSEGFNKAFLDNLIMKKQELEETINYLVNGQREDMSKISVDSFIDELDRTDMEISAQNFYRFLDRKKKELDKINILIDRVRHEQDFCFCEECGKQISEERLLIIPDAVLCVPCQRELEELERRTNLSKIPYNSSQWNKDLQSNSDEDLDDEGFFIKPDLERISFMDLEEVEQAEDLPEPEENNP